MTTETVPQSESLREIQANPMATTTATPSQQQTDLSFDPLDPFSFNPHNIPPVPRIEEQQTEQTEPEQNAPKQRRPRINHSIIQRALVVALKSLTDFTNKEIEAAVGVETRTVQKIYKKARDRGFDPEQRPIVLEMKHVDDGERTGRPRKRPLSVEPTQGSGEGDMESQLEAQIQAQLQVDGSSMLGLSGESGTGHIPNGTTTNPVVTNVPSTKDDGTKKRKRKDTTQRLKAGKRVVEGSTADGAKAPRKKNTDGKTTKATTKSTKGTGKVTKADTSKGAARTKASKKAKPDGAPVMSGTGATIPTGMEATPTSGGHPEPPNGLHPEPPNGHHPDPGTSLGHHVLQGGPHMDDMTMGGMGDDEAFNFDL
ncbi:hypothetical protein BJ508DRAFT_77417 [Ascobolus immersus RN42]|uniref:Uncharacterized protein n=1 Tax=Ascobolus immersus RN42 TaxID=1160509 RepID=A0A3N4IA99_ASCIM|nr:hypothetical protein BJ508DRAFT_77417 [Ascobolus immersus RN42]